MAYNNYVLTQKRVAVAIESWKLTRAHTGTIGFEGCKNSRHIQVLSGLKGLTYLPDKMSAVQCSRASQPAFNCPY